MKTDRFLHYQNWQKQFVSCQCIGNVTVFTKIGEFKKNHNTTYIIIQKTIATKNKK